MDKLKLLKDYLTNGDFAALVKTDNIIFWVDWREEDDAIIEYCEHCLNTGNLSASVKTAANEMGFVMCIHFNGADTIVPYKGNGADRDTTLTTLKNILQPGYDMRFCRDSDGSDTLAFLPLRQNEWKELEAEFGKAVDYYFGKMPAGEKIFNVSIEEMVARMEARRREQ